MKAIAIVVFILSNGYAISTYSQCNIKKYQGGSGNAVIEAEFEEIFKQVGKNNNGDYSQGSIIVQGRLSKVGEKYILQIALAAIGNLKDKLVLPRRLNIVFNNNQNLLLISDRYEFVQGQLHVFSYDLSLEEFNKFNNHIAKINLIDNRNETMFTFVMDYKPLFKEQLECIKKN